MLVITWNILSKEWLNRGDFKERDKGYLRNKYREGKIKRILKRYKYDIMMLQEVDRESYKFVGKELGSDYWISKLMVIKWEEDINKKTGNVIMVRRSKIKGEVIKERRVELGGGKRVLLVSYGDRVYINLHLTLKSSKLRMDHVRYIMDKLDKEYKGYRVVMGGDFNNDIMLDKRMHKYILKGGYKSVLRRMRPTYIHEGVMIDNIYERGYKKREGWVYDEWNGRDKDFKNLGSDHYPVISRIG